VVSQNEAINTSGFSTNNKEFEGRGFIVRRVGPVQDIHNRTITEYRHRYNKDNERLLRTSSLARTPIPS